MARCRLQHSEGAPRRTPHSGPVAVCDIREAAGRERVAGTAGNRPLFYFRFGERTFLRERTPATQRHCTQRCGPGLGGPGALCLSPRSPDEVTWVFGGRSRVVTDPGTRVVPLTQGRR